MKRRAKIRAVVLAAGRGERLRPLTDAVPKPMLPVLGRPVIERTLESLASLGCEAVAINLHHLGDKISNHLGDRFGDMPLVYSREETLLGTLGALVKLHDFLREAEVALVINGDSLCRWPLKKIVYRHLKGGAKATLLVTRRADPQMFGGGIILARDGAVGSFGRERGEEEGEASAASDADGASKVKRRVFAGAQAIDPRVLDGLPEKPSDTVRDLYRPMLASGERIATVESSHPWHDLGTPQRYLEGVLDWARYEGHLHHKRTWTAPRSLCDKTSKLRQAIVEDGARIGASVRLDRALVFPGAQVTTGATVRYSIVGPDTTVPRGAWVERRLVTREPTGRAADEESSVVEGVIYTPFFKTHDEGSGDIPVDRGLEEEEDESPPEDGERA
ncbi:MAG TPA: NDP-sugar synthase [Thermoanaerobaculia bacterium]|nr:NDP-sugar synthase [Thermoanaerobaculia bacterium]